jgi:1-acyl-sn-glycerol-3-phosphate acyltransferase
MRDMEDSFLTIRPYTEAEALIAFRRIFSQSDFVRALALFEPNMNVEYQLNHYQDYRSIADIQQSIARPFVQWFVDNTTSGVHLQGLDNLENEKCYVFLANHRDIVFDTAILQYYFFINNHPTSRIAIGDNLLSTKLLEDVGKINKMITVNRSCSIREKLFNYKQLSDYIHQSCLKEHQSVWIAQRSGRTKDGNDLTQIGLIKMLAMHDPKHPIDTLKRLNIIPVTVSYEYEPCDNLKARELSLTNNGIYEKSEGEDFNSIKQGLFGQKGKVYLRIGKEINTDLEQICPKLPVHDIFSKVCQIIDKQIYLNYELYPNNYIAADILTSSSKHQTQYTPEEKEKFLQYLKKQSATGDVPKIRMYENLLNIYANPVFNKENLTV